MGLFEDAQREVDQSRLEQHARDAAVHVASQSRTSDNSLAVAEFIEAMRRLNIAPQNHRFWTVKNGKCKRLAGRVKGWLAEHPEGLFRPKPQQLYDALLPGGTYIMQHDGSGYPGPVVTPEGRVYQTRVENTGGYYDQPVNLGSVDFRPDLSRGIVAVLRSRS